MSWAGYVALTGKMIKAAFRLYLWVNLCEEDYLEDQGVARK